jgi:hypothetical protein
VKTFAVVKCVLGDSEDHGMSASPSARAGAPASGSDVAPPRHPDMVMSPARAAAAYPTALSFSRSLVRKMQAERWRIERLRIDLDGEGRGEGLYRVIPRSGGAFHFFAISNVFAPGEKVDRSFGINWDVSAAICQGEWTASREAVLREEIPKQYEGRYDADVLCFCRGNRSERIFDEVVDSLGEGRQPDTAMLASVGYILRSTAFAGNGLFGMKPFEGLGAAHPLGSPYDVQILAAFLLREFVFDLVDSMALARGTGAVRLDRRLKRYLGVGNSAGLGLIPFLANHPRIIDRWVRAQEEALAQARARQVTAGDPAAQAYLALARKAARYFAEDPRDGNGIFASFERLAGDAASLIARLEARLGRIAEPAPWATLIDEAAHRLHPETVEIANGLLLELYPDIVAHAERGMEALEEVEFEPEMTAGELRALARRDFGWLVTDGPRPPDETGFFWYYPVEAPYEPRRALRGRGLGFEHESPMDLPRALDALVALLSSTAPDASAAEIVARRPDLRAVIARVQATAGLGYADLRQNYIAADFTPFAACRFLLAFYGMEKFDPRPPRSTKGALLQGAPLADEIETGTAGEWPFPLVPDLAPGSRATGTPKLVPLRALESPEVSVQTIQKLAAGSEAAIRHTDPSHLFPLELRKLFTKAFLSQGCSLGVAEVLTRLVVPATALGLDTLDDILAAFEGWTAADGPRLREAARLDAGGAPAFAALPAAIDLACAAATAAEPGICRIEGARASALVGAGALGLARRGHFGVIADGTRGHVWIAGPGPDAAWLARSEESEPPRDLMGLIAPDPDRSPALQGGAPDGGVTVICLRRAGPSACPTPGCSEQWSPATIAAATARMNAEGLPVTAATFARLSRLAKRALVPEAVERQIVPQP